MQILSALPAKYAGKILLGILALFILGWLLVLFFFLIEPASPVENVMATNVTDHQASVSWTTKKPTRGAIVVSENGKFPFLPFFIKDLRKDDTDKGFLKMGFYNAHHVTIENLEPETAYQYMIYQGWKKVYRANLLTGPALQALPNPNPVYGQILEADRKTPAQGVLVFLQAKHQGTPSAYLSTITNREGRWSMDLGNLRSSNFAEGFPLNATTEEIITVQTGKSKFKATTLFGQDQPWPDLILSGK